jgi:phage gpG-like protein
MALGSMNLGPGMPELGALHFEMSVANQGKVSRVLTKVPAAITDLTNAWKSLASLFYSAQERRFAQEGANDGLPRWAELSDNPPGKGYRSWKAKHYPGAPILTLTGSLARSFQAGGTGNVTNIGPMHLEVGSVLRVGKYNLAMLHQLGTRRHSESDFGAGMPARPPVWFSKDFKNQAAELIRREIKHQMDEELAQAYGFDDGGEG